MSTFLISRNKALQPMRYFFFLFLSFILLEIVFTSFSDVFSSTTDRIKLKSTMFSYRGQTEILCLGSSRLKGAISPKGLTEQIKKETNISWKGFNGAITGTNIERLEYFFDKAIEKKGLKYIILEVSQPQLNRKKNDIEKEQKQEGLEAKSVAFLEKKSNLISYRKSIRLDNLKNIPAIIFSDYLQGSELYKKGTISDLYVDEKTEITKKTIQLWKPSVYIPQNDKEESVKRSDVLFYTFKKMVDKAAEKNVALLFVIPPLVNDAKMEETRPEINERYQKLSNVTKHKIYNFSTNDIPELFFRDKHSHFNKKGKYMFSIMVAKLMIKEYSLKQ